MARSDKLDHAHPALWFSALDLELARESIDHDPAEKHHLSELPELARKIKQRCKSCWTLCALDSTSRISRKNRTHAGVSA